MEGDIHKQEDVANNTCEALSDADPIAEALLEQVGLEIHQVLLVEASLLSLVADLLPFHPDLVRPKNLVVGTLIHRHWWDL